MREYLMSVIGAALLVGVVGMIIPAGAGEGLKRHVGLVGSLCVLCILISPATKVLGTLSEFSEGGWSGWFEESGEEYSRKYSDFLLSVGKENIERGIVALLGEKFGIPESECSVTAEVRERDGELEVVRVTVVLTGKSVLRDPYAIEAYISGLLGCECIVK
ncbi:MAG TPA: hypothetical protein GX011_03175 [Clostridiales bacterium]|jgi:hypothetical protein|nr:hypothetical protein [Clostridiales bacterium]